MTSRPPPGPARTDEVRLGRQGSSAGSATEPTATFSVPEIHGNRVPAVILVADRDRKTLVDQADAFLSHRIAVLRWQRKFETSGWAASMNPALAFLTNQPEIDLRRIFLVAESPDTLDTNKDKRRIAGVTLVPDIRMDSDAVDRISAWVNGGEPVK